MCLRCAPWGLAWRLFFRKVDAFAGFVMWARSRNDNGGSHGQVFRALIYESLNAYVPRLMELVHGVAVAVRG